MSHLYKDARPCQWCDYATRHRSHWAQHTKICKLRPVAADPEKVQLRDRVAADAERIQSLEQQLLAKDGHYQQELKTKDAQLLAKDAQLAAKDEQIAAANTRVANIEQMLGQQLMEVKEELRETKKRKDRHAEKTANRLKLTEPRRREILRRQNFMCADPDGECTLCGELEAFDIDHITPLWKDGDDSLDNMQALCPACHRRKTDRERLERSAGAPALQPGPEVEGSGGQV